MVLQKNIVLNVKLSENNTTTEVHIYAKITKNIIKS